MLPATRVSVGSAVVRTVDGLYTATARGAFEHCSVGLRTDALG